MKKGDLVFGVFMMLVVGMVSGGAVILIGLLSPGARWTVLAFVGGFSFALLLSFLFGGLMARAKRREGKSEGFPSVH